MQKVSRHMHNAPKSSDDAAEIGVLLFDRFSNHCLANAIEPLRAANGFLQRDAYRWRILSLDGDAVTSSSGFRLQPDAALADMPGGDFLFVLPSYGVRELGCAAALRQTAARFATLVGLDMGAWLLAEAGLLDGRAATIHFDEFEAFEMRFPSVEARRERWLIEGDRMTAAGAVAAYELSLQIIERRLGVPITLRIASLFMQRDVGDRARPGDGAARRGGDPRVAAAIAIMSDRIETPLGIPEIARLVGCSHRNLTSRFLRALGDEPREIYRRLRLNRARRLLESTELPATEIALRCGYSDASAFSRAFKRQFGRPPSSLRQ